jgi:hypothetical protein
MLNLRPLRVFISLALLAWLAIGVPHANSQPKSLNDIGSDKEHFLQVIGAAVPFMYYVENCVKQTGAIVSCGSGMNGVPAGIVGQTKGYLGALIVSTNGTITATANAKIAHTPTYILTPALRSGNPISIDWYVSGSCVHQYLCSTEVIRSE